MKNFFSFFITGKSFIIAAVIFSLIVISLFASSNESKKTSEKPQIKEEKKEVTYIDKREKMVSDQITARGVNKKVVIEAMLKVPREEFVPETIKEHAHLDRPLPIPAGQTISQPYIVALMTELLDPNQNDRVLEIGAGSGYQAAVLGHIVKEVYTIEIIEELANVAKTNLEKTGFKNVFVKHGDGYKGWAEKAPFDSIIITAAVKQIPQPLIDQLKEGGKIILPKGDPRSYQYLVLGIKKDGKIEEKSVTPVRFVPMTGEALSK